MKRIVLGISGSVPTAAAIGWLAEQFSSEIVTVTLDFGQGDELATIREHALALGAVRAHVIDVREEFVRDYLLPALQAGALANGHALVHPLLAGRLVDVARMETASAVAHCATAEKPGAAIESAIRSLDPAMQVIAPAATWTMSPQDLDTVARQTGVHVVAPNGSRIEASVWGRRIVSFCGGPIPGEAFTLTRDAAEGPIDAALIDVEFFEGVPVSTNGIDMSMLELMESLETIAGAHGVGRSASEIARPEDRTHALPIAVEAPAVRVLSIAHDALERHVLGEDLGDLKARLANLYSELLANGRWFSDLRDAIDAFTRITRARVSGTVRLTLCRGECTVVSCDASRDRGARVRVSRAVA